MDSTSSAVLVVAAVVVVVAFVVTVVLAHALARARAESVRLRAELAALTECIERLAETDRIRREAQVVQPGTVVALPDQYVITDAGNGRRPGEIPLSRRTMALTMGEPLVKVAAFSSGVGRALREETRAHIAYQVRREMKQRRRQRRHVRKRDP
jgi:hypothetical protein